MTLAGTRPPTVDEWDKYELHDSLFVGKDNMSIRVPEGFLELHKSFKIHSKQFVYETLTGWGLNPEKTYSFKGKYLEEQKMVVFCLKSEDL